MGETAECGTPTTADYATELQYYQTMVRKIIPPLSSSAELPLNKMETYLGTGTNYTPYGT
jgi:hypothetical protein